MFNLSKATLALVTALSLLSITTSVNAQSVCGKHADIVKRLNTGYEEFQSSAGIAANGNLVEVFSSKKGTWTIIFTKPGGMTCLMAVGEMWQTVKEPFKISGPKL